MLPRMRVGSVHRSRFGGEVVIAVGPSPNPGWGVGLREFREGATETGSKTVEVRLRVLKIFRCRRLLGRLLAFSEQLLPHSKW